MIEIKGKFVQASAIMCLTPEDGPDYFGFFVMFSDQKGFRVEAKNRKERDRELKRIVAAIDAERLEPANTVYRGLAELREQELLNRCVDRQLRGL